MPAVARTVEADVERARVVAQHERAGAAEHDQVAGRGVLADDRLRRAPERLLVDRVLGVVVGTERLADRREPHRHPRQQPPIDSSRADGLVERDRQPLGDLGRDRAIEERHAEPLGELRPHLGAARAVGRRDGHDRHGLVATHAEAS